MENNDAKKITDYLNNIYNSNAFKSMFGIDFDENQTLFEVVSGDILKYVIATRNFDFENIEWIINQAKNMKKDLTVDKLSGNNMFFNEIIIPKIYADLKQKHCSESNDIIENMNTILAILSENVNENGFFTHSFNGALIESIEKNGLDISQELFKEEYATLEVLGKTPWTKSNLCLTDPSKTSFVYCTLSPEKLYAGPLKGTQDVERDPKDKTDADFLLRKFRYAVENKKCFTSDDYGKANDEIEGKKLKDILSAEEYNKLIEAGEKICNFYGKASNAGIALIPKKKVKKTTTFKANIETSVILKLSFSELNNLNEENKLLINLYKDDMKNLIDNSKILFECVLPDISADPEFYRDVITSSFKSSVNQIFGNEAQAGWGVVVESGKVPREDFEILIVSTPFQITLEKINEKSNEKSNVAIK